MQWLLAHARGKRQDRAICHERDEAGIVGLRRQRSLLQGAVLPTLDVFGGHRGSADHIGHPRQHLGEEFRGHPSQHASAGSGKPHAKAKLDHVVDDIAPAPGEEGRTPSVDVDDPGLSASLP